MVGTVIDIETTGFLKFDINSDGVSLLSDKSEILEVGYINVDMDTKRIINSGTLYFYKPYFDIESDAQKVHGLTREFLQQFEKDFDNNLIALNSLIQCTCIIGKNSDKFDIPFIKAFIKKHAGMCFDIPNLVSQLDMKGYNGGYVTYTDNMYALDMQKIYVNRWKSQYFDKTGVNVPPNKKGTLSEYIDSIDGGREVTNKLYSIMPKVRETGAHGALYDCCMTYVVWYDACKAGLC